MSVQNNRLFIVMGVAGCGKSTVGNALADQLNGTYLEGDSFHPQSNIEKMSAGTPLTDDDRWPWLKIIGREMANAEGIIFAGCSALKLGYRDLIEKEAGERVTFIHLSGSQELIADRMAKRGGHFMPLSLLKSQFATLEPLIEREQAIVADISGSTDEIVAQIISEIKAQNKGS
ncbi:MAG: gluconokinase [Lentilitoribacter sp.]